MENERPTVAETYALAVGSSSLRMEEHKAGAVSIIAAAGMSQHRLGMALRRLRSEWDARAKPQRAGAQLLEAMATGYKRQEGGLVRLTVTEDGKRITRDVLPLEAAQAEANVWYEQDMLLLFQGLKTLQTARAGLAQWAEERHIEDAQHAASAVLRWWLDPKCRTCHGLGLQVIPGTGRTGRRKCDACHGKQEIKVPRGDVGLRVLQYMGECLRGSAADLRESLSKMRRAPKAAARRLPAVRVLEPAAAPLLVAAGGAQRPAPAAEWMPVFVEPPRKARTVVLYVHVTLLDADQAKHNQGGQTLQVLRERGGLSPCEALAIAEKRRWREMKDGEALRRLYVLAQARGRKKLDADHG